jgi:DMSO/TMAO reductase YedYZ molybdopterin-dependent catalytic subunit
MTRASTAAAGALGVAAALAVGELAAGLLAGVPSPIDAVGQLVVDGAPGPVVTGALATLGAANRPLLAFGTVVIAVLIGAAAAVVGHDRPWLTGGVFATAGVLGVAASLAQPGTDSGLVVLVLALAVLVGHTVLRRTLPAPTPSPGTDALPLPDLAAPAGSRPASLEPPGSRPASPAPAPPVSRRHVLRLAVGTGAAVVLVGAAGRWWLGGGGRVDPASIALPAPARGLPPAGADLATSIAGVSPAMTPIDDFFRIDTALGVPRIDPDSWRLRIHGRVEREVELTYDELLALPLREVDVTIACVSNEVGGQLVGTARWLGVPLAEVLARAGVRDDAEQLLGRSADGWTAGFPVALALDGREALVAVGMQGETLPAVHGFPARLIVPGLYGYVSATKWLTELELTAWDGVDGYWIPRGWAKEAPVKTSSRIDVPRPGAAVAAGDVVVAGVAWAPTRGIAGVEVAVDEGSWVAAELVPGGSEDTWVQWHAELPLTPGRHRLTVRATDGGGDVQSAGPRPPAPDGAEGWHTVDVEVA